MDLGIVGRTALVTGASAGIGVGVAECLAREGVRLALAGRNRDALENVGRRVTAYGAGAPVLITADVATEEGTAAIARTALDAFGGRVDFLINNAGGSRPLQVDETEAFWQEAHDLNFQSARRLINTLVASMKAARSGRIINITGAIFGRAVNGAGPSKAALLAYSRALSFELAPFDITINCVAPGRINSAQILEKLHPTEESRAEFIRQNIPAGRFGDPADMGNLVAFLVSPLAAYINGAHIPVDGGAVRLAT